jgi:ABC transporter DrrB family efflux protein
MATLTQTVDSGMTHRRAAGFIASTVTIIRRSALRYARTPQLIVMATLQMSIFFLIYRYMFAGAMRSVGVPYVDYLAPGFIATGVLFSGIGAAVAMAEDLEQGFVDRLRSLPIPRSSVLAARAIADTGILALAAGVTVAIAYAVGFRLHGSLLAGLAAFGLVILFGFAFEWVFITIGLFAGGGQAAQGMGMIVFPFAFISSAYIVVSTMPGWLQAFAKHQPLTDMVDTVRALTLGSRATVVLGHPASHYLIGSLLWTAGILAVAVPLAIWRYRRG